MQRTVGLIDALSRTTVALGLFVVALILHERQVISLAAALVAVVLLVTALTGATLAPGIRLRRQSRPAAGLRRDKGNLNGHTPLPSYRRHPVNPLDGVTTRRH